MCEKECVLRERGCEKNVVSNFISCNHKYFISDINKNFSIYFGKYMINLQCICKQSFLCSICAVTITEFYFTSSFYHELWKAGCVSELQISPVTGESIHFGNIVRVMTGRSA